MTDLIIPDGYAQVQMRWRNANFDSGGATTSFGIVLADDTLQEAAAFYASQWDDHLRPIQDDDVILDSVAVVTATEGGIETVGAAGQSTGQPMLAPNTSVLIRLQTQRRGRRGRGRMFPPGFAQEIQVNDRGDLVTAWQNDLSVAFANFLALTFSPLRDTVILQRTTPTGPNAPQNPTPPISPPPVVTSVTCDGKVATQRRRLRR